jgi:hypothetical protein
MHQSYPLRAVTAEEFPAFADVSGQAFLRPWEPEAIEYERLTIEYDRTFAMASSWWVLRAPSASG